MNKKGFFKLKNIDNIKKSDIVFLTLGIILIIIYIIIHKTPIEKNEDCFNQCVEEGWENGSYTGGLINCFCKNNTVDIFDGINNDFSTW